MPTQRYTSLSVKLLTHPVQQGYSNCYVLKVNMMGVNPSGKAFGQVFLPSQEGGLGETAWRPVHCVYIKSRHKVIHAGRRLSREFVASGCPMLLIVALRNPDV